ncbi:MAG: radical SAM protein [Clostridiales Family XIII bacterium]|jgi:radical SAM superfamily enzyme YgiQ (UPF0313 family)|nr:radical SAM protein [Clostridiales Family XIII bacterium]
MRYEGNIYRPPSEAYSLIVQVTIGCAHNACTFCSMFKDKQFRVRKPAEVFEDLAWARAQYSRVGRIFLADGDALVLSNNKLLAILEEIERLFPECERVTVYGSPQDVLRKTPAELRELREAGAGIVYIGAESGSDAVLAAVKKGATAAELREAIQRLEAAGIAASVTFISGLGGHALSREHAVESARLITEANPSYAALLTLILEPDAPMYADLKSGQFTYLSPEEVARETLLLLENARPEGPCVFRSNHASNYVPLRGTLPGDTARLMADLEHALDAGAFKSDHFRML